MQETSWNPVDWLKTDLAQPGGGYTGSAAEIVGSVGGGAGGFAAAGPAGAVGGSATGSLAARQGVQEIQEHWLGMQDPDTSWGQLVVNEAPKVAGEAAIDTLLMGTGKLLKQG